VTNINVLDHVERCYSNGDGKVILDLLKAAFSGGESVTLSFQGVTSVTSSFTNTALIELLKEYNLSYIKKHLRFVNTNKLINDMIKARFAFESKRSDHKELSVV